MQDKCWLYRSRRRCLCNRAGARGGKAVSPPRLRGRTAGLGWAGPGRAWLCGRHGSRDGARALVAGGAARPERSRGRADRLCLPPGPACRSLCAAAAPELSYQQLKDLKKANVLHIDVRERWEIDRFGKIPESINIPLGELMEALQMDPTEFKEQYNQKMPSKSDPVVFSCLAGTRSKQALGFATSLGFSRVQQYAGGFDDWVKHEPPEKK
ncbi:thiosulfate sulfurtransferase/rhodanese-like domain-containing protein 3 [Pyrgilauda ruficollis]|nr:thiosulfate sulfurtransferase/rhodanese-like domain-containing protein 3 [Pyrgilauda ruficollis]